ncbi:ornithine cyclodeaminase family protein [Candidatus Bathyarchaeota archaeon]|nr:ornithine cyclodeaminase family protein [Candidatus Bathyarchaeota archaeon]MBS7630060.1 ornithine cyclodeaminase family protein [Candidatus Bathyarchaeota archaeon]
MLIISDEDIEKHVSMREAIDIVEKAFREYAKGFVKMPPRSTIMLERFGGSLSLMPSYLEESGALATKIISIYPKNRKRGYPTTAAWIVVNDPETGVMEALMDATYLTALRTGAVTGVASRCLAPRSPKIAAVVGCGVQGRMQAWAMAEVFNLEKINAFDISRERIECFARELEGTLGIDIHISENCEEAVENADIIATATTSKTPVVRRNWLSKDVHINAIGSFYPDHRELDSEIIKDAKVVVDSREAVLDEAGDLLIPIREGKITRDHIYAELGEILLGIKKGRTNGDKLTVFKSVGLAIQDSSVAKMVIDKMRKR